MAEEKQSYSDLIKAAKQAEADEDFKKAVDLYAKALAEDAYDINVYNRLMILYHKQKLFKDELRIINKGIKNILKLHAERQKKSNKKAVISLSKLLMKSTGLTDKKGNAIYQPQPISKWKTRKEAVEKKIMKNR